MQANNVMRATSQECIDYQEVGQREAQLIPGDAEKHLFDNVAFKLSLEHLSWLSSTERAFQVKRETKSYGIPAH